MREPYLGGGADYRGYPAHTDEEVAAAVERALREGRQLLAHCNGDAAAGQFLTACRRAQERVGAAGGDHPAGDDSRPDRGERSAPGGGGTGGHSLLFCRPHLVLGGCAPGEPGTRAGSAHQPRGDRRRAGPPLYPPPGLPGFAPRPPGERMVRRLPPHPGRDAPGGGGADLPPGGPAGGDPLCRPPVRSGAGAGAHCPRTAGADFVLLSGDPTAVEPEEIRSLRVEETIRAGETVYRAGIQKTDR